MTAAANERQRIADWLDARAKLLNDESSLELCITAEAIRRNDIGPDGMLASEPILNGWKPGDDLNKWLERGAETR